MVVACFVSTNLQRSEALALVTMEPKVRSLWINSEAVWCVSTSFNISISISIHIATLWVSYCWCRISAFKPVGFVSEIDILNTVHLYTVYLLITIECHLITYFRLIQIVWSCEAIWMIKTLAMLARLLVSWRSLAGGHSYCPFLGLSWCGGWVLVQMKLDIS